ncbi:MAG: hypothetical protein ACAI43_03300 [Phycisphaerae bacterium]|nr:hypothetical protein [Tepidisphaeraceae bacterium]
MVLSTVAAVGTWLACRAGSEMELAASALGLFIAGAVGVVLVVPPCVAARDCGGERAMAVVATVLPWAVMWAVVAIRTDTFFSEWSGAVLVLASLAAAAGGLAVLLSNVRVPRAGAAAIAVAAGLAWVTWPVWLASAKSLMGHAPSAEPGAPVPTGVWAAAGVCVGACFVLGPRAGVRALAIGWVALILLHYGALELHPGLAINGQVYRGLGSWIELSVAYHLTELNQSVPYTFPASVWPTVVWHFAVGALGISGLPARWRNRVLSQPVPEVERRT